MILNGTRITHIQRSGAILTKIGITLVCLLFLVSCSAGRGDYYIELQAGYAIDHVNSRKIDITHKEDGEVGRSVVIENYYITSYCLTDIYIALEGIPTAGWAASEDELESEQRNYYLIDTLSGDLSGPFESKTDFTKFCNTLNFAIFEEWVVIKN